MTARLIAHVTSFFLLAPTSLPAHASSGQPEPIAFRFLRPTHCQPSSLHFVANVEFFRPGLVAGITRQRADFATALRRAGIMALRFPGGNAAYFYFPESKAATLKLAHAIGYWEFRDDRPPNNGFASLAALAKFSRDYHIHLIYQLPCLFYLDGDRPRAIIRSSFSDKAPWLYDHDRIGAGVAYGIEIARRLRKWGARVAVWELGNEEFAHCDPRDFARVAAAYLEALQAIDPNTPVAIPAMKWGNDLLPALDTAGALRNVDLLAVHYPFGHWPGPPSPDRRDDPAAFVSGNLDFPRWLRGFDSFRGRRAPWTKVAVTETTVMHFQFWEPAKIVPTLSHALCYAWNWIDLLQRPEVGVAVFHDLETPFFGMIRYSVWWDANARQFRWLAGHPPPPSAPTFPHRYVLSPTALANYLLSRLCGQRLVHVEPSTLPDLRAIASSTAAVIVNRSDESAVVTLPLAPSRAVALVGQNLSSALPSDFALIAVETRQTKDASRLTLPPHSIVFVCRTTAQ